MRERGGHGAPGLAGVDLDRTIGSKAYARELATLNARAEALLGDVETLRAHARNVSGLELQAAGFNRSALRTATEDLDPLTGLGPSAILQRFLGETTGEVELTTASGLRVEVEGEDGEHSLEVKRPRDDDASITVAQEAALETARSTLPTGNWTLRKASVHPDSGYYKFEFTLLATGLTGEAEVRVDGSSGEVFRLEVETERPDEDDRAERDEDDDRDDRELTLLLVGGTPAPDATVTVRVLADGEPASNVTVTVNGHTVARTDAQGEATLTLPHAAEVEVVAGDDAELEFEFDADEHEAREVYRQLDANATLADGRVTVTVTFDGAPVEGATVYANDHRFGPTGSDGTVSFAFDPNATDELEIEIVKGAFEAELEYDVRHGGLVLTESAHQGDGDKVEDDHDEADTSERDEDEHEDDEHEEEDVDTPEGDDHEEDEEDADTPEDDEHEEEEDADTPEDDEHEEEDVDTPEGDEHEEDEEDVETPEDDEHEDEEDDHHTETPEDDDDETSSSGSGDD